uniref:putative nuclease HARBI1 n=1 Tax=Erigeron canadensis TaxID=72917 RepID=UPI001CB8AFB4|nr:putative nuclease HARBI1 [Erigeron canadensis]
MDDEIYLGTQHLAAINLVCLVVALIIHRRRCNRKCLIDPEMMLHNKKVRQEILHNLTTSGKCRKLIRMSENAFMILCQKLKSECGLQATQRMCVEEQVVTFLHIVGHDLRTSHVSWLYRRSESATNTHFHRVLNAILSLEDQYIQQPTGDIVPKEIQEKKRFYPFSKDCIGAIDGTHIRVKVANKDAARYRGRKGYPTINVLCTCTFDLKFTYVLSGWEGTASDSRIIKDALTRDDKLVIPNGKFYLVDGGFPHKSTLVAPYRGVRYHLKEYSSRGPRNKRELFNLRHASLRNSIERAFGVLKKRFAILRCSEPFYSPEIQSDIFLACCILHNFLQEVDRNQELEDKVARKILSATQDLEPYAPREIDDSGDQLRSSIANEMWNEYLLDPNNEINMSI